MYPIDGEELLYRYESKRNGNKNIDVLIKIVRDSIESMPMLDLSPEIQDTGVISEYDNGMVAMRKETYNEYNKIAIQQLPKSYVKKELSAKEYLETLREMHKNKSRRQFFKMFPEGLSDDEKIAFVESWREQNMHLF